MQTVKLTEEAIHTLESMGYGIRHEYMGGIGGGGCEIGGKKWVFLDLALNAEEQLAQLLDALRRDQATYSMSMSPQLESALSMRRAA